MFLAPLQTELPLGERARPEPAGAMPDLLGMLAEASSRPRYAFMLLSLIAEVADAKGSAGPWVRQAHGHVLLRDWLCDALAAMGDRDPRRKALQAKVEAELGKAGLLPADAEAARRLVLDEVHLRARATGKTNLSHTVSELVRAGLLRRHYQGYRVDHENRGAQRLAVYTLAGAARMLLARRPAG